MLVKSLILDRNERVGQVICDHVSGDRDSVGIRRHQLSYLIFLGVIYKGRKTLRADIYNGLVGSALDHSSENTDSKARTCNSESDHAYQKKVCYCENDLFHPLTALGSKIVLSAPYSSSTKIHIMNLFLSEYKFISVL